MVDRTEQRIYELIKPWCGRSWLTRRTPELTGETSLNMTLN
ncbi:acyl carrier protein, partial [Cronobacter sakazakii]